MIGIQRVLEGTDWPLCSAVYCVGMPGSLNTVVQFLGRAMRLKGADYPADQRDRAKLVFFVPCGGGSALADLSIDHSRHALLTCCFLADHEVGQEWIVTAGSPPRHRSRPWPPRRQSRRRRCRERSRRTARPGVRAEVELAMADAREQIIRNGSEPTVGEVVQLAAKTRPDLPEAAIHRVADGDSRRQRIIQPAARLAKRSSAKSRQRLRIDPKVKQAMAEAFAVVLEEFRDATLKDSAVLESVGRQVHGVTGGQMREFAQRLRDAAPRPLTEELILAWADAHHKLTAEWPGQDSGPIADAPGDTWININASLRIGLRGLPGGSSIALLLQEKRNVRNIANLTLLTKGQILAWADGHFQTTNEWPGQKSGAILDAPGETWGGINNALARGIRGLAGGSSLPQLLAAERGVRNHLVLHS